MTDAAELVKLATHLRESAYFCTTLPDLEMHCRSTAERLEAIAAQQDGGREAKPVWVIQADGSYKEGWEVTGEFGGMKFIADKSIPNDVIEVHHPDGRIERFHRDEQDVL